MMASLGTAGFPPPERRQLQGKSGGCVGAPGSEAAAVRRASPGWEAAPKRSRAGVGHYAGGGAGVRQELDTVQGVVLESGRSWTQCRGVAAISAGLAGCNRG